MATTVSFKFRDITLAETTEVVHFPTAITAAEIDAWVDAAVEDLDDAISAQILSVKINIDKDLSGATLKATPAAGSRISSGVALSFETADGAPYLVFVPSVADSFLTGGTVSMTGALDAFKDDLLTGVFVDPTQVIASDRSDSLLESFRGAKKADRDKL